MHIKRLALLILSAVLIAGWAGCGWASESADLVQGEKALDEGEPTVAESYFAAADSSSNHDPIVLRQIAGIYGKAGMKKETIRWLQRLVKADPSIPNREAAAFSEAQNGELDEGCRELASIFGSYSDDPRVVNDYAYICLVEPGRDLDRAIALLQSAVDLTHRDGTVVDSLGWAYVQRFRKLHQPEDLRTGTGLLEEAAVITPMDEIRSHLTTAYTLGDRPEVVNRLLEHQWILEDSFGGARILRHKGPFNKAEIDPVVDLLEDAVEQRPQDALARLHLSLAYRAAGRNPEAFVEQEKAIALDPTSALPRPN